MICRSTGLLFLLVTVGAFSGCSKEKDEEQPAGLPFEGVSLSVAVPEGWQGTQLWQPVLDEWSTQTGAKVELERVADVDATVLGNQGLALIPLTQLSELRVKNFAAEMPESFQSADHLSWKTVFPGVRKAWGGEDTAPRVLPLASPTLVLYYRKDLLEKAKLKPPETWSEYQTLLETLDEWGQGLTAVEPWSEEFRATMFLARAVSSAQAPGNFSLYFDIGSGEPLIDSPAFVRALEQAKIQLQWLSPEVLTYSPLDCRREFLEGRAALAIAYEWGTTKPKLPFGIGQQVPTEKKLKRADDLDIGFVRLPGATQVYNAFREEWQSPVANVNYTTLTGFAGLGAVVSTQVSEKEQEAAWSLLEILSLKNAVVLFPGSAGTPTRGTTRSQARSYVGPELTSGEAVAYWQTVAASFKDPNGVSELPVLGRDEFRLALTEELTKAFNETNTPAAALELVAERWRKILEKLGRDRVVDSYRLSLGLSAQTKLKD